MRTIYKPEIHSCDKKEIYEFIAFVAIQLDRALIALDNDEVVKAILILKGDE